MIETDVVDFIVPAMAVPVMTTNAAGKKVVKRDHTGKAIVSYKVLAKERPRFGTSKRGVHITYNTQKTVDFESWIRRAFFNAYPGQGGVWYKGKAWPVHNQFIGCSSSGFQKCTVCTKFRQGKDFLDCQVCDSRRKNLSLCVEVHLKDERHIDLDNIVKIVLDSLNKVCYFDDTQFCMKKVILVPYAKEEHLRVKIGWVAPFYKSGSLVGIFSIKNMKVADAKEYAKILITHFCGNKDEIVKESFDKLIAYLQRCDGRNYIATLEKEML